MNPDAHARARLLIASSGPEGIPGAEQAWLAAHLESCAPCREFAENSVETIRSLRAIPFAAGVSLVAATQARVRERAIELRRRREQLWLMCACCAVVSLCTVLTAGVLWCGFAWVGQQARLPAPLWEICFAALCLMPVIMVEILLLARGSSPLDRQGSYQG